MKIKENLIKQLASFVIHMGEREEDIDNPLQIQFSIDDITVIFFRNTLTNKNNFYGLIFETLGRDFIVDNDYNILIQAEDEEENISTYAINDKNLINALESYIEWRINVLQKFEF